jgi:hypothetical protein
MTTNTNKILGAAIAIAIIISVIVFIYVSLPKQPGSSSEDNTPPETNPTVLTLIYDDQQINYTMALLERLEPYTAKGGYRNQLGIIKGYGNYTGVNITTLVDNFHEIPRQYSLQVTDVDGEILMYNFTTISGQVDIYNPENASETLGNGNMTMVLAYKYERNWLNQTNNGNDGNLKIVFLDEQGSITKASLWWKKVVSIRIITE